MKLECKEEMKGHHFACVCRRSFGSNCRFVLSFEGSLSQDVISGKWSLVEAAIILWSVV